jgi:alkylated DNA repair protein (DNA oxidative demethylase)
MSGNSGFQYLPAYFGPAEQKRLLAEVRAVIAAAPLFLPTMPGTGKPFSVRMTNCGPLGWVSDKLGGYRYQPVHPVTGGRWPAIPSTLIDLWRSVAHYPAEPEACLVNFFAPGARLGSHIDADEENTRAPVVSISLGADATFHLGGPSRSDPKRRIRLRSGDVVVLGGESRRWYHGVDRIFPGTSDLLQEDGRFSLTLRRVTNPG